MSRTKEDVPVQIAAAPVVKPVMAVPEVGVQEVVAEGSASE
ncbi:hypothetical protein [Parasphingorhabdus halotolerans]|nr:hypothetical protein [Parasphingorhabdus halotolerans]